jgi:eukaryotic-like serine/threonine-protein kinase
MKRIPPEDQEGEYISPSDCQEERKSAKDTWVEVRWVIIAPLMGIAAGSKLGQYEICGDLGAGGMGEVYRARDPRLGREVALKVLPEALAADAQRIERFEREAKVLASLNHPNIGSIYGFEDSSGVHALVMELVEGSTLAARIAQGKILLDEALPIAKQIADGLEYAHERGIVHRDLKPANVKITPEGAVKILDFGLAKALEGDLASVDISSSPTLSRMATQAGMILGTAAYMSPEQAKGKPVDRRTDIWGFGCVFFEMLTGKKPFDGETVTDVLAAVVRGEPDWSLLPANTPPAARSLLQRCLKKDVKQRMQAAGDVRIVIEETMSGVSSLLGTQEEGRSQGRVEATTPLRRVLPWAGTVLFAILAAVFAVGYFTRAPQQASLHFSTVTNLDGVQSQPALSPDGRSVAFVSNRDGRFNIYVGLISGGRLVQVTNDPNLKVRPAWSRDGTTIAYGRLNQSGIWDIWEVAALGGTPRRLILNATEPAWSPDGRSLAYENTATGTLWISGVAGEKAHQVAGPSGKRWRATEPRFSPDGKEIAFISRANGPYGELDVADVASGKVRTLTNDHALALSPAWSPDGRHIYFASSRSGTMNLWKMAATGRRVEQITAGGGDDAQLDVSADGKKIVFATWRLDTNIVRLDLEGKPGQQVAKLLTTDPGRNHVGPVYSPDGKRLTYFSNLKGAENESIWVANADGSDAVQLVRDNRVNVFPTWSTDSRHVIYQAETEVVTDDEYRSVAVSGGAPETMVKNAIDRFFDVGLDGRLLFRTAQDEITAFDPRDNKTEPLGTVYETVRTAPLRWSPDGRSVAYVVAASREEDPAAGLWVNDFKNPPRQIFRGWADWWFVRGQGNEIYFLEGKPDLNGVLCKIGWDGQGLTRMSATIPMIASYWVDPGRNSQDHFTVSPEGRYVAYQAQTVMGANIGMIENVR